MSKELSLASIGATHGYCFDGDEVAINVDLSFAAEALFAERQWALQLWASREPFSGMPQGSKLLDIEVFPLLGTSTLSTRLQVLPPAGGMAHHLALALVATDSAGVAEIVDLVAYALPEVFVQPRFSGVLACSVVDGMANLSVECIENPRADDNISGTLALEVWAMNAPYSGGDWQGLPVASIVLGVLGGGNQWLASDYVVSAAQPAPDAALTVMLREWTAAGYVTRDYRNLSVSQPKVAKEKPVAKAKPKAGKPAKAKDAEKAPAKPEKTKASEKKLPSINLVSEKDLLGVKGLSEKLARAIVAGRPYASIDGLAQIKGVGPKLLLKLTEQFVV